jgi:hypothetical protein
MLVYAILILMGTVLHSYCEVTFAKKKENMLSGSTVTYTYEGTKEESK